MGFLLSQVQEIYPYNFVTCSQAQQLANKLGEGKRISYKFNVWHTVGFDV